MAKLIRCVEGHVFDPATGKCPECGWSVEQPQQYEADAATPGSGSLALPFALGVGGTAVVAAILYAIFIHPPAPPKPNATIAVPPAPNAPQAPTAATPGARTAAPPASTLPAKGLVAPTLSEPDKWPIGSNAIVMLIRKISKDVFERRQPPEFCPDGWSRGAAFEHRRPAPSFVTQDRSNYYDVCLRTTRPLGNLKYLGPAGLTLDGSPSLHAQTSETPPEVDTPLMMEMISIHPAGTANVATNECVGLFETSEGQCLDLIPVFHAAPFVVVRTAHAGNCPPGKELLPSNPTCLSWPSTPAGPSGFWDAYPNAYEFTERLQKSGDERLLIVQERHSQARFRAPRLVPNELRSIIAQGRESPGPLTAPHLDRSNEKARQTGACKQGTVFANARYCLIEP